MKITRLHVQGYRSLKEVTWEPGRLNVIIGPNGSGKSNLLRSLELLRSAATGSLDDAITQQGGMQSILWDHRAPKVAFELKTQGAYYLPRLATDVEMNYNLVLRRLGSAGNFQIEEESLRRLPDGDFIFDRERDRFTIGSESYELIGNESALGHIRRPSEAPSLEATAYDLRSFLFSFRSYHDLRVDRNAPVRQASITKYDRLLQPDGQNLVGVLHTLYTEDPEFEESIDAGMRAGFGSDFKKLLFGPAADQRVQLRIRLAGMRMAPSSEDLSDGTLRFLMMLTIFRIAPLIGFVAINEPETSLHPSMLKVLADFASEASQSAQVVLATQSPEFLDALTPHEPTVTVLNWVEGKTQLRTIDGDELKRWLSEYTLGALHRSGELEEME